MLLAVFCRKKRQLLKRQHARQKRRKCGSTGARCVLRCVLTRVRKLILVRITNESACT